MNHSMLKRHEPNANDSKKAVFILSKIPIKDIVAYVGTMLGIAFIILRGASEQGYFWQWYQVPKYLFTLEDGTFALGPLLQGLKVTLNITWISMILTYAIGLLTALLRLSDSIVGRAFARIYLELARNTPLIVQLFFIYFVVALGVGLVWLYMALKGFSTENNYKWSRRMFTVSILNITLLSLMMSVG